MNHADYMIMPAGYWHHIQYDDSSFAMRLHTLHPTLSGKIIGAWNLFGMRTIDTLMKKTAPRWWYHQKEQKLFLRANKLLKKVSA